MSSDARAFLLCCDWLAFREQLGTSRGHSASLVSLSSCRLRQCSPCAAMDVRSSSKSSSNGLGALSAKSPGDSLAGGAPTDGSGSTPRPKGLPQRKKSLSCSTLPVLAAPKSIPKVPTNALVLVNRPLTRASSLANLGNRQPRRGLGSRGSSTIGLDVTPLTARVSARPSAVSHEDIRLGATLPPPSFSDFLNDDVRQRGRLSPSAKCVSWLEHMQSVGGGRCLADAVHKDAANA